MDITAIVTVTDDGGSSGRLRRELGVLPPGDIRNCLVALADDESLLSPLFQHRFAEGDLSGHSFGNLFLAALTEVSGELRPGVQESSRVLKIRGRVLPSTLEQIRLWAERADGDVVSGETRIAAGPGRLPPRLARARARRPRAGPRRHPRGRPRAARPGQPLHQRAAPPGGARGGRGAGRRPRPARLRLQRHDPAGRDRRLRRRRPPGARARRGAGRAWTRSWSTRGRSTPRWAAAYAAQGQEPVRTDRDRLRGLGIQVVAGDLAEPGRVVRHSPEALATVLVDLVREAAGAHPATS